MIKHTYETLKYYIGKEVYIFEDGIKARLLGLCPDGNLKDAIIQVKECAQNKDWSGIGIPDLMPILRPLMNDLDDTLSFGRIKAILNSDSMAIPSEGSVTGYADLFGMPCVLPSMADASTKFGNCD